MYNFQATRVAHVWDINRKIIVLTAHTQITISRRPLITKLPLLAPIPVPRNDSIRLLHILSTRQEIFLEVRKCELAHNSCEVPRVARARGPLGRLRTARSIQAIGDKLVLYPVDVALPQRLAIDGLDGDLVLWDHHLALRHAAAGDPEPGTGDFGSEDCSAGQVPEHTWVALGSDVKSG